MMISLPHTIFMFSEEQIAEILWLIKQNAQQGPPGPQGIQGPQGFSFFNQGHLVQVQRENEVHQVHKDGQDHQECQQYLFYRKKENEKMMYLMNKLLAKKQLLLKELEKINKEISELERKMLDIAKYARLSKELEKINKEISELEMDEESLAF